MADNKAKPGRKPYTEPTAEKPSGISQLQSNQERGTGTASRRVAIPTPDYDDQAYTGKRIKVGNQVRLGPNSKGSDTLKDPLNSYQRKVGPAVANPDPIESRDSSPYVRRAAKKASNQQKTSL